MDYIQILSYLKGDTTQQERNAMIEWIEESESNKTEFISFRRIFDASLLMNQGGVFSYSQTEKAVG